ncbi:unnamed protein product [Rotaria sp. Silwood2]|nr:unnamed protein product [Rotaria sp. Silwood2]CAF2779969.1 unnamed protein product [Rotaria sp. Silwood2]CAF3406852.1 unnamed protein product [Rotaria sp. Silwood2]CAF3961512.1 unnamed protein product [Rotaria sp. Silwood2]CAF4143461.1 unnamed protein product [Rotaria sp. Silwood2]
MFLYDAGQLAIGEKSLDLTEARLNTIDLRNQRCLINISLKGTHLNNASFVGQNLSYGNFTNAHLNHANFSGSICIDNTDLGGATFLATNLSYANLSHIQCPGTLGNISACQLRQALILENAQMPNRSLELLPITLLYSEGQPHCRSSVLG